jgi:hypothetical protein
LLDEEGSTIAPSLPTRNIYIPPASINSGNSDYMPEDISRRKTLRIMLGGAGTILFAGALALGARYLIKDPEDYEGVRWGWDTVEFQGNGDYPSNIAFKTADEYCKKYGGNSSTDHGCNKDYWQDEIVKKNKDMDDKFDLGKIKKGYKLLVPVVR